VNLLNRYLLSQFVKFFFTVNAGFVSIYLLVDFFEKYDDFLNAGKPTSLALKYFLFTIPSIVDLMCPVLVLLAGVLTLGLLAHSNELTALKAGGVPLRLIIQPILLGAIVLTVLFFASAEWLLPVTVPKTNNIWFEQLKGKVPLGILRNGRYFYRGKDGFYSFAWPNPKSYEFVNFSYSQWDQKYDIGSLLTAKNAYWNPQDKNWLLMDGQIQEKEENGEFSITNFAKSRFVLPEIPENFLIPLNKAAEESLTSLYWEIDRTEVEHEKIQATTAFYGRVSYMLLGFPLLLLGLPILLYSYQKWGRDLSVAIPASCGLAFIAWGIWGALQSLATAGYVSPFIAATSLHFLFAATGMVLLIKNDR
jgi:lipopolysaccharide export system permease protein